MTLLFTPIHNLFLIVAITSGFSIKAQIADIPINPNSTWNGEESLAIDPTNPNHLVVAWMKYIFLPAPASVMIATSTSTNGGLTWSTPINIPHNKPAWTSADPTLAFKNDGTIYLGFIDSNNAKDSAAVFVTKSTNGGTAWGPLSKVVDFNDSPDLIFDRPWLTVDNSGGPYNGYLYMATMSYKADPLPHHVYLTRSIDGGTTWGAHLLVDNTIPLGPSVQAMGVPTVSKDGRLYIAYLSYNPAQSLFPRFIYALSTDGGSSLTNSVILTGVGTSITNDTLLQYSYKLDANPTNSNNLVFSYVDKSNSDYDIYSANSNNGGINWNTAIRVSSDAINNGNNQDMLWANFSTTGKYAATWRDRRANSGAQNQPYKIWGSYSGDGGNSFSSNFQISQTDGHLQIPVDGVDFLGCVLNDTIVYTSWADKRNTTSNQLFINKFKLSTITSVSQEQLSKNGIKLFPNPNTGEFTIEFEKAEQRKIEILDITGRIAYSTNSKSTSYKMDQKLVPGNYFVRITENRTVETLPFIIE
ncbi:MAG: T9SS type A sorting domain-containing protein [Bacteroidota bacterium]|nr:T9SS type A sorting domain-containing protein [Bacteroidota bacterium]